MVPAPAAHGIATGFRSLLVCRFLLGVGEGGGFPAATKAVAEWFPARERSFAMGIINAGTAIGAVIAPPAIAAILVTASWRIVFFATGVVGLLGTIWWLRTHVSRLPVISSSCRLPSASRSPKCWPGRLRRANRPRHGRTCSRIRRWGLVFAKFLSDAAWYFYLFWLPKYLYDVRGFDVKQVGYYAWIHAAAGVGCLTGGWLSGWLLSHGRSLNAARKIALGCSAAVMPLIVFVTRAPPTRDRAVQHRFLRQQSWSTLVMIVPTDPFPRRIVASVAGMVGFGGARRRRLQSDCRPDSGQRPQVRPRLQHRRHLPCGRIHGDPVDNMRRTAGHEGHDRLRSDLAAVRLTELN